MKWTCNTAGSSPDGRQILVHVECEGDAIVLPLHLRHAASQLLEAIGFPEVAHCLADEIARRNRVSFPMKPYGKPLEPAAAPVTGAAFNAIPFAEVADRLRKAGSI